MVINSSATDELTLDSSGAFSFDTELSDGDACDVQIIAQPANPENVCTVENGGGTVSSADIDNVPSGSVWANRYEPASGWSRPELVETETGEVTGMVELAVHENGDAVAVWVQFDGTHVNIHANRYTDGSGWGSARIIDDVDEVVSIARVAVDDAGNALGVWEQTRGTPFDIWGSRYSVANGWEAAESISSGEVLYPKIAFDASGHALSGRAQAKFASIVSSNPEKAFPVFCLEKSPCHYCSEP